MQTTTTLDGDDVRYYIDWDDGNEEWTDFAASGTSVTVYHTWDYDGTYLIKAKAEDTNGAESGWGTLTVTMPKNKPFIFNFNLLEWLFERFPNAFPILRQLLGL